MSAAQGLALFHLWIDRFLGARIDGVGGIIWTDRSGANGFVDCSGGEGARRVDRKNVGPIGLRFVDSVNGAVASKERRDGGSMGSWAEAFDGCVDPVVEGSTDRRIEVPFAGGVGGSVD